jgi:hypothetical protein
MVKKVSDQDENQPFDYFKQVEHTKKPDKPSSENLVSAMRSDMLTTSDSTPAEKHTLEKIDLKVVVGVLLALFMVVLIWFILAGPGRPGLEHGLAVLVRHESSPTPLLVPSPIPATSTPLQPTKIPIARPTLRPSSTPTTRIVVSPTPLEPTSTPTSASACRDALTITLVDVGQTLCVQGVVIETVERPNAFMVIFNSQPGSFYWVSYDMVWSKAKLDTCYQTTGKVEQIANSPIMLFSYNNLPEVCP